MRDTFVNTLDWRTIVAALTIWAAHFMALWSFSSIFPGQPLARWLAAGLTVLAIAALAWLWRRKGVALRSIPGLGLAISVVSVLFSSLPALVG